MTPLLSVANLERTFGAVVAAHNINCDFTAGEVVGIIGANGAGKTTFVNMITGHLRPSGGTITFEGNDVTGVPSRDLIRRGISRSFQVAQVFPSLTARENIAAAVAIAQSGGRLIPAIRTRLMAGAILREADALLDTFRITEHRHSTARSLAQGVRKILDIAMACASKPRLLLLDEPTAGVSMEERTVLMTQVMGAFKARQITILFVEHDMEIVRAFAHRVLAFYDGKVIADGRPTDVLMRDDVRRMITGSKVAEAHS
jgi:branched-chain amino acid transport system ATP-binding protein